jgi:hypothetical protein
MPPSRQVAESAFELLMLQLVDNIRTKSQAQPEACVAQLEKLGFSVGSRLVDKCAIDRSRFTTTLEIVKFVCKDFWTDAFGKQVDGLRTNHRGVYVLIDNKFRWLLHTSLPESADESLRATFTAFPCGLLSGALTSLGVPCTVTAEFTTPPQVTFTLKLTGDALGGK